MAGSGTPVDRRSTMKLAPADDKLARDWIAEQLGVPRDDINQIRVRDWITGEVLVSFHSDRKPQTAFLEPDDRIAPWAGHYGR